MLFSLGLPGLGVMVLSFGFQGLGFEALHFTAVVLWDFGLMIEFKHRGLNFRINSSMLYLSKSVLLKWFKWFCMFMVIALTVRIHCFRFCSASPGSPTGRDDRPG